MGRISAKAGFIPPLPRPLFSSRSLSPDFVQVKAAEAEAESKYLSGVGVSRQRKAIVDGLRDSVETFSKTIDGGIFENTPIPL